MDHLGRRKDFGAANRIAAVLDTAPRQQVDPPFEQTGEFVLHLRQIEQRRACVGSERHQHVDVALRRKILAEHGSEQGELGNLPLAAEAGDPVTVDRDLNRHRPLPVVLDACPSAHSIFASNIDGNTSMATP
jgi:hypothetical protein